MAKLYISNNEDSYSKLLNDVHNRMINKMKNNTLKRNAAELQTILQDIKKRAHDFDNVDTSVLGNAMQNEYDQLIHTAFTIQSSYRNKNFKASTLFRRGKRAKTVKEADNIFEEDLAAILAAGEILGGNKEVKLQDFLIGTQSTGTRASRYYKGLEEEISDKKIEKLLKKLGEKEERRASSQIKDATGKIDISGASITLNYSKDLPFNVQRLMYLMKDATISAKSYTSRAWDLENKKDWSEIGLHLGNTNLYKAVTGALSEVQMGHKQQLEFFYRGLNTILYNSHGDGSLTTKHFRHLRFIYEIRGSGLLNQNGYVAPVKYLIYNDPSSDAIFVKDTASLILEALNASSRSSKVLGEISITATKINSKK